MSENSSEKKPAGEVKKDAKEEKAPAEKGKENTTPRSGDENTSTPKSTFGTKPGFKEQFKAFSKFGDTKSDGKHITLSQSDKWMKQAKVIDGKKVTTTDTGIYFKKFKSLKISIEDYRKFVEELAKNKKINLDDVDVKMSQCGPPGLSGSSSNAKIDSTVERLTDVSKYTGSHKQRFDETGKGKGIAGRRDVSESSGYVHGYQNKDTYSKTH